MTRKTHTHNRHNHTRKSLIQDCSTHGRLGAACSDRDCLRWQLGYVWMQSLLYSPFTYLERLKLTQSTPIYRLQLGQILVPGRRILAAKRQSSRRSPCRWNQLAPLWPNRRTLSPVLLEQLQGRRRQYHLQDQGTQRATTRRRPCESLQYVL